MHSKENYAASMLVVGCILFGLGSLIVKFVPVGGYSIPLLSLGLTGLLLLSEPVAALIIDYFYLDKAINVWQWIGAGLTLFAIYLGSVKR